MTLASASGSFLGLAPLGPLSFVFFPLTGAWMAHGAAVVPTCSSTPSPTPSLLGDRHTDMATAWLPQDGGAWTALLPEPDVQAASCALVSAWERGRPFPGHTFVPSLYRCSDASLRDHESRLQEGPESLRVAHSAALRRLPLQAAVPLGQAQAAFAGVDPHCPLPGGTGLEAGDRLGGAGGGIWVPDCPTGRLCSAWLATSERSQGGRHQEALLGPLAGECF